MRQNHGSTSDDMASIGRAIVEAITELRTTLDSLSSSPRLASLRPLTGGDELLFTATVAVAVREIFVTNVTGSTATDMRLHHVAVGGTVSQDNALYFDRPMADGETVAVRTNIKLAVGDTLWVRSATGGNISFNVYGS